MVRISKTFATFLTLIVLMSCLTLLTVKPVNAQARTLVVPTDYPTIQQAINSANNGDTVFVKSGLYNETLAITKSIFLIGEDRNSTIIDARGSQTQVILIKGDNITVANLTLGNTSTHTIKNSGDYLHLGEGGGILIDYPSHNVNVTNNTVIACPVIGIYVYRTTIIGLNTTIIPNVNILGNLIISSETAIQIYDINCFVINNTFAQTSYGVKFESENVIVGIAEGPSNGTMITLSERNVVEGNQEISLTTIPSPFPSSMPSTTAYSTPTPTVEFSWLIILPLFIFILSIAVIVRLRKTQKITQH
jgi:hypothetical protein